jgi:hypothetical protein
MIRICFFPLLDLLSPKAQNRCFPSRNNDILARGSVSRIKNGRYKMEENKARNYRNSQSL